MSADNWAVCPRCLKREIERREDLDKQVKEKYGKLAQSEYLALVEKSKVPQQPVKQTLCEDYKLGTNEDGLFEVNYSCGCSVCGYKAKFNYSKELAVV